MSIFTINYMEGEPKRPTDFNVAKYNHESALQRMINHEYPEAAVNAAIAEIHYKKAGAESMLNRLHTDVLYKLELRVYDELPKRNYGGIAFSESPLYKRFEEIRENPRLLVKKD